MTPTPAPSLPPEYDGCILGRSVSPFDLPVVPGRPNRLVYSLSGLMTVHDGDRDAVAALMKDAFTEYGHDAPVFVDDQPPEPVQLPEPVILKKEILAPSPIITPFPGTHVPR